MSLPCKARCLNQKNGICQLDDERIKNSQVEFGEEWMPEEECVGFVPSEKNRESDNKKRS